MTVDVEEYFQVSAFANIVRRADWDRLDSRVEDNVSRILDLFAAHDVHGTFFTLGWIAQRHPAMVRRIAAAGHEIASHGFQHVRVHDQTPAVFREDAATTRKILEDIAGIPVRGYRAASFSITRRTPWAFAELEAAGYAYSSSVYPIRHDHYGIPDAPRFAYRPEGAGHLIEIPISTVNLFGRNLPCGGGGYFRLLPYGVSRWAMRRVNRRDGQPCMFYFHPWEIDPQQPRFGSVGLKTRFRHYTNLRRMEARLRAVLADFAWDRVDRVFLEAGHGAGPNREES
ncbi:MAG: DUF3473 domain-containing protein [Alphaproteobacteria bacterium]|nr:MAG: DUF3473 domain-containing protein [Alphaproteobacteria bacterium]